MSFHEQNLEAFIELLSDKRSARLFSPEDRASLEQLIAPIPDDIEKLSTAIAAWYEKRPKILDAHLDVLNNNLLSSRTTSDRTAGSQIGNISLPDGQVNKLALQNAIQHGLSSGKLQSSKSERQREK